MASVFKQNVKVSNRTPVEIVRDTLDVNGKGEVRFRCRTGRGSGKGIEIPDRQQFNEFVEMMIEVRDTFEMLVENNSQSTEVTGESDTPSE